MSRACFSGKPFSSSRLWYSLSMMYSRSRRNGSASGFPEEVASMFMHLTVREAKAPTGPRSSRAHCSLSSGMIARVRTDHSRMCSFLRSWAPPPKGNQLSGLGPLASAKKAATKANMYRAWHVTSFTPLESSGPTSFSAWYQWFLAEA
ncbi:hypothetical protein PspLS_09456 [Pyricularia sp. CBS 133598]|nr:hypothetical protein PspLS_09456 [Pyricularia sp. CBS 133598]